MALPAHDLKPYDLKPIGSPATSEESDLAQPEQELSRADQLRAKGVDEQWIDTFLAQEEGRDIYRATQPPFMAGIDMAQAQFWKGIDTAAQVAGIDTPDFITDSIQENLKEASETNIDGLWDKVAFGAGQIVPAAGGMLAGAATAPILGAGATVGATAMGTLAAMGMTTGDVQMKAEELDPEHLPTWGQLGYSALLTAPDMFIIGKAKTIMAPMKELITDTVMKKGAKAASGPAKAIAKGSLQTGAAEGLQDLGGGLGANYFTDTAIDASRVEALAKSAVDEAIVGTILGVPLMGANVATARVAQAQREFDDNRKLDLEKRGDIADRQLRDSEGNISEEVVSLVPSEDAVNNLGLFTTAYNTLTGNITSRLKARHQGNKYVQAFGRQFNVTAKERAYAGNAIPEEAQAMLAKQEGAAQVFYDAPVSEQDAAWERRANDEADMSNPVDASLYQSLNEEARHQAYIASRGQLDVSEGKWTDKTYLPTYNMIDWGAVANDPNARNKMEEGMIEAGVEPDAIKLNLGIFDSKMSDYKKYGNSMHMGADRKSVQWQDRMKANLARARESGKPAVAKAIIKDMQDVYQSDRKRSAATLDRALKDVPQSWFQSYQRKDTSVAKALRIHQKLQAEELAHINAFGVDLEGIETLIAKAIEEGDRIGQPIEARDIEEMYNISRTSQRISLNPLTKDMRERQQKIRAAVTTMTMGLASLASIPEAMIVPMKTGIRPALKGLAATMKITDKQKTIVAAEQLGMSLNTSTDHVLNRIGEEAIDATAWESAFIKLTGLPYIQHFLSIWAAKSQDIYLRNQLDQLNSGNLDAGESNLTYRKLAEAGIDVEKAKDWASKGYDITEESGKLFFENEWVPKLVRLTRDTIVDPNPVDKPLWMNDERFMLVSQLKGFMTNFTNRVLQQTFSQVRMEGPGANRELAMRIAPYLTMYLLGQVAMGAMREVARTGEIDDEKVMAERIWNAFGYMGSVAYFTDTINAMRYRSDPTASVAGPAFSIGNRMVGDTVRNIEEMDAAGAVNDIIKRGFPNMPFKDLMLEGMGVE